MPKRQSAGVAAAGIVTATGPTAGAISVASLGLYGGQFAVKFMPPYNQYATIACLFLLTYGGILAMIACAHPVLGIWRGSKASAVNRPPRPG